MNREKMLTTDGLYNKFHVCRLDGRDQPGGDKENANYFVLDIANDPYAWAALGEYAYLCRRVYPELSKDLYELLERYSDSSE